jgi:hypothetical protein
VGITVKEATAIVRICLNDPIRGRLLVCGRQSMFLTPAEAEELLRSHGLVPKLSADQCKLDYETRIGGETQARRSGDSISDVSFFEMLGVSSVEFLDHSEYEGAQTVVDLNFPIPPEMADRYDFIIDGGTLDNIFNPAQALMNFARMLKTGGRLLAYNFYSNFGATYTNLPHQWYLDYFALNRFQFAQTYLCTFEPGDGRTSVYQVNLAKRAASRSTILNFPSLEPAMGIGLMAYAVKAADSTWERQPSQECYRSPGEWQEMEPIFSRFAAGGLRIPVLTSTGTLPIYLPGGDDFQFIDKDGELVTQQSYARYEQKLRERVIGAILHFDAAMGNQEWGIFETEKMFYDVLAESPQARAVIAKSNVALFDVRMLNKSAVVDGVTKVIHPGTSAMAANMPILIICTEPTVEVLWRRLSRLFRHLRLYSACSFRQLSAVAAESTLMKFVSARPSEQGHVDHESTRLESSGQLEDYFKSGLYLSASLEEGSYQGYSEPGMFQMIRERKEPARVLWNDVSGWEIQRQLFRRYWKRIRSLLEPIS